MRFPIDNNGLRHSPDVYAAERSKFRAGAVVRSRMGKHFAFFLFKFIFFKGALLHYLEGMNSSIISLFIS